jgi:glycosyltransferase involved in cell wall biosynthesis
MTRKMHNNNLKPRVLISGVLPPPFGGMATYYQSLLDSSLPEKVNLEFVQTSSQKRDFTKSGQFLLSNIILAMADCWRFFIAMCKFHPQIAHIGTAFGLSFLKNSICVFIAVLFRSKVLLHPHCSFQTLYSDQARISQWYIRQVFRLSGGVAALSLEWNKLLQDLPNTKIYYLPNAIDVKLYQQALETHLSQSNTREPITILYLGHIGQEKGSLDIVEAASLLKSQGYEMTFELVGTGLFLGEKNQIQVKINESGLNNYVKVNPPAFDEEKMTYFQNADVFIYPSFHEGMPMAILEAMASGLPIVATRIGGIPDLVQDNINGFLVDPGCPEQLALALIKLNESPDLRSSMQKMSYKIAADKFNIENHVRELVNIYFSMINQ